VFISQGLNRVLKGIGSTAFGQVVAAASSILLVPLFLSAWGSDVYGRWISLNALCSYLLLLELGGQNYFANLLTEAYSTGNEGQFRDLLSKGVSLFLYLALAGLILWVIVLFLPILHDPETRTALGPQERLILFFLGFANLITIPGGVYATIYRASGKLARGNYVGNSLRFVIFCSLALTLLLKQPPLIYALVLWVDGWVLTWIVILDIHRQFPLSRRIRVSLAQAMKGARSLRVSVYFWLINLAAMLNTQGILLVMGANLPAGMVALYSTQKTTAGLLGYITNLFHAPLWPEFTSLNALGQKEPLQKITLVSIRLMIVLTGLGAIVLWFFVPWLYPIWTGQQLEYNPILQFVFLLQGILLAGWYTAAWPLFATNQHRLPSFALISNAAVTILLAWLLVRPYGVTGAALASLAGDLVFGFFLFPFITSRIFDIPYSKLLISLGKPVIVLVVFVTLIQVVRGSPGESYRVILAFVLFIFGALPVVWLSVGKESFIWLKSQIHFPKSLAPG
jgi:O-antigen/teichoic acid export membrane protein